LTFITNSNYLKMQLSQYKFSSNTTDSINAMFEINDVDSIIQIEHLFLSKTENNLHERLINK